MNNSIIMFPRVCSICGSPNAEHVIDANGFGDMDERLCDRCSLTLDQLQASRVAIEQYEMRLSKLRVVK